jgi:Ca2+-binding RTX toxin-like protein
LSCWGTNVDLTGNEIANTLIGNDTANILNGGGGDDVMIGDTGADTYVVDSSNDTVNEAGTDGAIDIVSTSLAAFSLQSYALVENLYAGNASGAVLTGNALSNRIVGHNGADVFDGGSGGIDNLEGARGNDVYYIRTSTQNAQEEAGFGTDEVHVKAAIDYALTADSEVELLQADGGYASTVAVKSLKGGKSANSIISNAGDTTLDGGGGAGDAVDVLHGGIGDDTYVVRRSGDIVEEAVDASGGTQDVVEVYTGSYTLIDTMGIEVLQAGGTTNIDLTGNAHANTILGNGGANTLRGNGGNDLISGGGGIDTVVFGGARADYTVTRQLDGSYLVADKRAGLDGQDKLVSIERFQFADKLQSETELTPDVVIEPEEPEEPEDPTEPGPVTPGPVTPGPGTGGGASAVTIKNLSLTGTKAKDQLIGGKGNDTFFGKLGNDMLIGSDGRDLFVFDTKPDARKNLDWITDFTVGQDRIGLDGAVFKALPKKGSLAAPAGLKKGAFFMGKEAKAADDRIVYDAKKGALFYDADGKGGADQIQIAKLAKGLKLSAQDFFVV